jgi:hypothetical protein
MYTLELPIPRKTRAGSLGWVEEARHCPEAIISHQDASLPDTYVSRILVFTDTAGVEPFHGLRKVDPWCLFPGFPEDVRTFEEEPPSYNPPFIRLNLLSKGRELTRRVSASLDTVYDFSALGQPFHAASGLRSLSNVQEATRRVSAFLDSVYDYSKRGKEDYAMDVIFEYMNSLFVERNFEACDLILREINIARIPVVLMVSFLTITAADRAELNNRKFFYQSVKRLVEKERGEIATQRLLEGLD